MNIQLTKLFCEIDDFYRTFKQSIPNHLLTASPRINFPWTVPPCTLSPSEMMLVVAFRRRNQSSAGEPSGLKRGRKKWWAPCPVGPDVE